MNLSGRLQRIWEHALETRSNPPADTFQCDFQNAAIHLYAEKDLWERAALSFAHALRSAPVVITEDDQLIGRTCHLNPIKSKASDPVLGNYFSQAPRPFSGTDLHPDYPLLAQLNLVLYPVRGHITWNWKKLLELGTDGLKAQYRNALSTARDAEAEHFYRGVLVALEALEDWSDRHAEYLDGIGRGELAQLCRRVPRYPARNFREAVQSFFFQYIAVFCENPFGGNGPGQLDKYLWPYLQRDLENGICTMNEARELITELFIRLDERVSTKDTWNEMIVAGGTHSDGSSAITPLTDLITEVIMDLNITHPSVYMRVPANPSPDYVRLCARYIQHGGNRAQIYYDPNIMNAMIETEGIRFEDAAEYSVGGCMEVGVQGMNSDYLQNGWINLPLMLELTLNGGRRLLDGSEVPSVGIPLPGLSAHSTFESFYQNFLAYVDRLLEMSFEMIERYSVYDGMNRPAYLISSMIDDCLQRGRPMHAGGCRYHEYGLTPLGIPNVIDELYAVREAVYERRLCTAQELVEALQADFQGFERLRRRLQAIPKYGQDNAEVDAFARRVTSEIADLFLKRRNRYGGHLRPMILNFTYTPVAAEKLGATPDGNCAHTMPAQALTPQSRSMTSGITAAMNSCTCLPFQKFSGGAATMWDLDPAWATEELIADLLMTFFQNAGQIFQGNATDVKELIEAQKHPEDYGHLIVRVGGFSARFVGLTAGLQTDIINRRRHSS